MFCQEFIRAAGFDYRRSPPFSSSLSSPSPPPRLPPPLPPSSSLCPSPLQLSHILHNLQVKISLQTSELEAHKGTIAALHKERKERQEYIYHLETEVESCKIRIFKMEIQREEQLPTVKVNTEGEGEEEAMSSIDEESNKELIHSISKDLEQFGSPNTSEVEKYSDRKSQEEEGDISAFERRLFASPKSATDSESESESSKQPSSSEQQSEPPSEPVSEPEEPQRRRPPLPSPVAPPRYSPLALLPLPYTKKFKSLVKLLISTMTISLKTLSLPSHHQSSHTLETLKKNLILFVADFNRRYGELKGEGFAEYEEAKMVRVLKELGCEIEYLYETMTRHRVGIKGRGIGGGMVREEQVEGKRGKEERTTAKK